MLDTRAQLYSTLGNQVPQLAEIATRFAGHMALRLVHDHLLRMDVKTYDKIIRTRVAQINAKVSAVKRVSVLTWLKQLTLIYKFCFLIAAF